MHHEQEVQSIAYRIWEEEGHPHGHDLEHWLKAEAAWKEKHAHAAPAGQQMALPHNVAAPHKPSSAIQARDVRTQAQPRPPAR